MRLPMNIVAKRTGLSQHVIRVWEKRYGVVIPDRTQSGQRLYTDADVARLSLLQRLTRAGHQISGIATLPTEELERIWQRETPGLPMPDSAQPNERIIGDALRSIIAMDRLALEETLRKSAVSFGAHGSLEKIVAPLTERIGALWREGTLNAAHEHFASAAIREFLWSAIRPFTPGSHAPTIIVTTPTGQLHELGAVIVAAAAADLGWRVTYLGPSLPPAEIAAAAVQHGARAVALSIVYPEDDSRLPGELKILRKYLPAPMQIIAGGRAAGAYRDALEEIEALQPGNLQALYDELNAMRSTHPQSGERGR